MGKINGKMLNSILCKLKEDIHNLFNEVSDEVLNVAVCVSGETLSAEVGTGYPVKHFTIYGTTFIGYGSGGQGCEIHETELEVLQKAMKLVYRSERKIHAVCEFTYIKKG